MSKPTAPKPFLISLLAVLLFTGTAHAWWNTEWAVRKKITVNASAAGIQEPVESVPLLIRLHEGNFQFLAAREDGSDLRFVTEDDKTVLTHHIERYDGLLNEAFVWVKVPEITPGTPVSFWLYYGNGGSSGERTEDSKGTYDADTTLIYHFAERGQQVPVDSSGSGNHGENAGIAVEGALIGSGIRLDGKSAIHIPASPSLAWSQGAAVSWLAWIKPAILQENAVIFQREDNGNALYVRLDNGIPVVEITTAGTSERSPAGAPVAPNVWSHLAVVSTGGQTTLYVNGEVYATLAVGLPALNSTLQLGGENGFSGELDELQLARVARSAGYVKLAAVSQGGVDADKLLVLDADEQPSSWLSWLEGGYMGVIIKNLTFDGWVVIILLAVMAVISWYVMVSKVRYLNTVVRGNALFLNQWSRFSSNLTSLDETGADNMEAIAGDVAADDRKAIKRSPIFRIYHIGVEEIRHRLALRPETPKSLSSRGIQAIRASLDGGLVRETQKINRLIVLLTICISGGPFLGLLGTVIGVMITFAAVAAAGDVNVNAIAPGIAAALLATVAGLAVAIPALFGYNYILSRVKDVKDDMHIFIDELVTKMAEQYRGGPAE